MLGLLSDPGRGRTTSSCARFYKHTIPPGLGSIIAFGIELNYRIAMKLTSERSHVYRKRMLGLYLTPARVAQPHHVYVSINIQSLRGIKMNINP
jgi:hypothetical protein